MGDCKNWYQQEFDFEFTPVKIAPKRKKVDYKALYKELCKGPLSFAQIEALSGVPHNGVAQVITTLSLHYPVYEVSRGIYKLYGDDDYGDGINRDALREYGYEDL